MELVVNLIRSFDPDQPHFRATEIYNENWLVKGVLNQASLSAPDEFPLSFARQATWFSEAYLPTAFKARFHGDPLSEARTHADGVVGHFTVGKNAKADLHMKRNAHQFAVVEAKMGSPLSSGTSNAPGYDQAARTVACMAEALRRAELQASDIERLAFIVLAPAAAIGTGAFSKQMTVSSIREKVQKRVAAYEGKLDEWYQDWFGPLIECVELHTLSWEDVLAWVGKSDPAAAKTLHAFYEKCLVFN